MTDKQLLNLLAGIRALAMSVYPTAEKVNTENDRKLVFALGKIAGSAERALDRYWDTHTADE